MQVTLPDGNSLELPDGATGADAAAAIGPGLAKAALAIRVNGDLRDLARPLEDGAPIQILTGRDEPDALELIRHDAAHVLATAVMELYPGVKISIGPPIEQGFYYDFDFPEGTHVSEADFEAIEAKMREHIAADEPFVREEGVETVSLYTNGPFTDLCRGPHSPSTGRVGAFKLQSVAGAYWRGKADNPMLTRIYGTAFPTKKELDEHLERLEQARARDHRKIGQELELFMFSPVSPGSPFWQPNGMAVWNALAALWREQNRARGYHEVKTPILYDVELWKQSGHWDRYREHMYFTEVEDRPMGLKPMNCPAHSQLYKN